ncbi:MAG: hypothetical protein A4E28_02939 [Methanocella sp. PtaU1.Bin125]|nr:MAG: hypothetical protein A4E28_02939 [Methanocella sp. PtaU1.Bin125]
MDDSDLQFLETLAGLTEKVEIAETLCRALSRYTIADLQRASAAMEHEVIQLPSPYRERVKPYFAEQYFGRYCKIMSMHGNGECPRPSGTVRDPKLYREYCAMMSGMKTPADEIGFGDGDDEGDRFLRLYYYLVSAFYMFVLDQPGHPVGMPFPGGFKVRQEGAEFICPIRDKEKDVESSICNFCPAKQDEALK